MMTETDQMFNKPLEYYFNTNPRSLGFFFLPAYGIAGYISYDGDIYFYTKRNNKRMMEKKRKNKKRKNKK